MKSANEARAWSQDTTQGSDENWHELAMVVLNLQPLVFTAEEKQISLRLMREDFARRAALWSDDRGSAG